MAELASSLKLLLYISIIACIFFPFGLITDGAGLLAHMVALAAYLLKVTIASLLLATLETVIAKMRVFRVPNLLGIALMLEGDIPWNQFWILFGLAGWATATVLGVAVIGPQVTGINRAALAYGPESDEVVRRTRRLFLIFRFDAALLLLIVLDMALKPFA